MVTPINFPRSLLRERSGRLELGRRVISPGQGGSGILPLINFDGGGLWEMEYGAIALTTPDHIRAWEALTGISDGGVTPFVVPWCGCVENPRLIEGAAPAAGGNIPFSDKVSFSDGAYWSQQNIIAQTGGATYALRATVLTIHILQGGKIRGGEHFTIVHATAGARLYRIVSVAQSDPVNLPNTYQCTIRPPLREAIPGNTAIDFDNPRCVMQLADPRAMDLTRDMRRLGNPNASFIESFP